MTWRALLALAAAALLAGCVTAPPDGGAPWTSGRMSIRIEADGANPARSVGSAFELRGDAQRGELHLNSPLGTRLAAANWSPGAAWLITPQGERRFANLDDLSRAALGEALPLAALPDWLAGRPWAGAEHRVLDDGFEQLGWHVVLTRRAEGWIVASRAGQPAVEVRVKLDAVER